MAFMGVLLVIVMIAAAFGAALFLGIVPIIAGTILIKKTTHQKLGVALRIFGYIVTLPLLTVAGLMVWWFLRR